MVAVFLVVMLFIVTDFVTGLAASIAAGQYSSSVMRKGLWHKAGEIALMLFGILVDYSVNYIDIGLNVKVTYAFAVYILLMEIGSIIENIHQLNPNILPENITKYFSKLNGKGDNSNDWKKGV